MTFDSALRLTELCAGLALAQSSAEHWAMTSRWRWFYALRFGLALALAFDFQAPLAAAVLLIAGTFILHLHDGPYNGGSDRMSLLILCCVLGAHLASTVVLKEVALGYLAFQVLWSYAMAGWVKIVNPEWRTGLALREVFEYSAYPASESLRGWARRPRLLVGMGWLVMLLELFMPLAILNGTLLKFALVLSGGFHLANACLFGLNRFLWIWLAAYPALIWFQSRVIG
jgi:hypothetical protein